METTQKSAEELKSLVREKYTEIVEEKSSCCGSSCCGMEESKADFDYSTFSEDYKALPGYHPKADLKLGCGLPTQHAGIRLGDTVVDLGSGAGNDAFVAMELVGTHGRVIGVDMTAAMIAKARKNAESLGVSNVEFRLGEIEAVPVDSNSCDVVVSNCVMNLVPDKRKAFSETFRILKPGGHFSISDIVLRATLPKSIRDAATMYAGCVSGAVLKDEYLAVVSEAGFKNVAVQAEKPIFLPDDIIEKYLDSAESEWYRANEPVILSITLFGEKP